MAIEARIAANGTGNIGSIAGRDRPVCAIWEHPARIAGRAATFLIANVTCPGAFLQEI